MPTNRAVPHESTWPVAKCALVISLCSGQKRGPEHRRRLGALPITPIQNVKDQRNGGLVGSPFRNSSQAQWPDKEASWPLCCYQLQYMSAKRKREIADVSFAVGFENGSRWQCSLSAGFAIRSVHSRYAQLVIGIPDFLSSFLGNLVRGLCFPGTGTSSADRLTSLW